MKARWYILVIVVIAAIAAAGLFVVRRNAPPAKAAQQDPKPAVEEEISLPATLQAVTTIPVPIPIQGKVESFQVDVGAEVYEGQLLALIRSEALNTIQQAAEVDLENAETRVRNLESLLSAARLEASRASADASRVRNDYERAQKAYQRYKMLLDEGATPRLTFEKAEKEYVALEAEAKNLDAVAAAAEERISSVSRELDAARKILEGKSEDVEVAKARVGSGEVLSPATGIVVARRGQAGDDVHPSMADLFQIATDTSVLQAVADASPAQIAKVKQGLPATVTLAEMAGEVLHGSVIKAENGKVTVEFANPNTLIKPGLTAQIRIKLT
jgi:multidrug resistance efflux pump